jgi:hypothetical protein
MAINLQWTDTKTQVTADYWDCQNMTIDPINNVTNFNLGIYVSAAAFASGYQPIYVIEFNIPGQLTKDQCFSYIIANYQIFLTATVI